MVDAVPISRSRQGVSARLLAVVSLTGPFLAWYLIVVTTGVPESFLPAPHRVIEALVTQFPVLLSSSVVTLEEIAIGSLLGVTGGVGAAIVLVWSPVLEKAFMPWIVFFHSVPKILVAPLFAVWFGSGITSQVIIVVLVVAFPILVPTVLGLKSVEPDMMDLIRSTGASQWQIFSKARIPASLPYFFSGLKLAASFATVGAIVGEWVGGDAGLGILLVRASYRSQTSLMFAAVIVIVVIGLLLYRLTTVAERIALPWHVAVRGEELPSASS